MLNEPHWRKALRSLTLQTIHRLGGKATLLDICEATGQPGKLVSPRLTELAEMGVIRDSGERLHAGRGKPKVVWVEVDVTGDDETPGVNDGRTSEVPKWFQRYGN